MHHLLHMRTPRWTRSGNQCIGRAIATWLMLLLAITPLPAVAGIHYECTAGMAQAGPACPLCHGHATRTERGLGNSPCCREVINTAPTATAPTTPTVELAHVSAMLLPGVRAHGVEPPARTASAAESRRLRPILQTSSVILRL